MSYESNLNRCHRAPSPPHASEKPLLLSVRDVTKSFPVSKLKNAPSTTVLRKVSFDVHQNEMVSIVGPSGSGKSTLLHCVSGLERPDAGSIELVGHSIVGMKAEKLARIRRQHVAFVFQTYHLIDALCAEDNVMLPARLSGRTPCRQEIRDLFAEVGLAGQERKQIDSLSGGQQQRVAVARALASNADIIFADEPTGALDTRNASHIIALLRKAVDETPKGAVLVTHDLDAASAADRALLLKDGRIVSEIIHPSPHAIMGAMEASV